MPCLHHAPSHPPMCIISPSVHSLLSHVHALLSMHSPTNPTCTYLPFLPTCVPLMIVLGSVPRSPIYWSVFLSVQGWIF
jgi:hypothetical protein